MKPFGSFAIGCMRFCWGHEETKIMVNAVRSDMSLPFAASSVPQNPLKTRLVRNRSFSVVHLLKARGWSQIFPGVVRWITVCVVNFMSGIRALHKCPSHVMCPYFVQVYRHHSVAILSSPASYGARSDPAATNSIDDDPGFRIVIKGFTEALDRGTFHILDMPNRFMEGNI